MSKNNGTVEQNQKINNTLYQESRGIELAHIFNYGDKYSQSMDVTFTNSSGMQEYIYGGCYGIGVTRTIAAIIENSSDDNGIIWPLALAPFKFHLIYQEKNTYEALKIYNQLGMNNVLMDDRNESFGVKLKDADLFGMPYQIILGNNIEIKHRKTNEITDFTSIKLLMDYINTL